MFNFLRKPRTQGLGLDLKPGDEHYRAYVGPLQDYDLVAAMGFNLLTCAGLRQNHRLLDIGCGSLRIGRLFIPYLNAGNYIGVEPNRWLVEDGNRQRAARLRFFAGGTGIGCCLLISRLGQFPMADGLPWHSSFS